MISDTDNDATLIPTVAELGLLFPVAVLSLEDATRLADEQFVVPISTQDDDPSSGIPITVFPADHGEGVLAWSVPAFIQLLEDGPTKDVESLLDEYPPYMMCGYRIAEMLLAVDGRPVDRGLLLKLSEERRVFLDSNDLRLIRHSPHNPACGCAYGRMVTFIDVIESLLADEPTNGTDPDSTGPLQP